MAKYATKEQIFDVPLDTVHSTLVMQLLEDASRNLGEVNNFATKAVEYDFIVQTLKNIESLASARIEGTTGNLKDLYLEEGLATERKKQLKLFSATNYRMAINELESILAKHGKLDSDLICYFHKLLTEDDPATAGMPGELRTKNVKIANSKLGDFFPADHSNVSSFIDLLIDNLSVTSNLPKLVQTAITHFQFEAIHPFRDGNGRTGRFIIVAQLLLGKTLQAPMLNLSQYFDENRDEYIASLRSVTDENSYETWVKFFLVAVKVQSTKNKKLVERLAQIEKEDRLHINKNLHSPAALQILHHALNNLHITIPNTAKYLKKQRISGDLLQVARLNIIRLVEEGVLETTDHKFGRAKVYTHKKLREFLIDR